MQFLKQRQIFKQRPPEETEEMKALDEKEKAEAEKQSAERTDAVSADMIARAQKQ